MRFTNKNHTVTGEPGCVSTRVVRSRNPSGDASRLDSLSSSLRHTAVACGLMAFAFVSTPAVAQQAVQLPVVSSTSVDTTVSVPDRGTTYLAGVSSARSGRTQNGPIRSGTSSGFERNSSSMSVSVYIHDMQAMDEALLSMAPNTSGERDYSRANRPRTNTETVPESKPEVSAAEKAGKFEKLAKQADVAGKPGVAKLHWKAAAKYGSKLAETRLAELNSSTANPSSAKTPKPLASSQTSTR